MKKELPLEGVCETFVRLDVVTCIRRVRQFGLPAGLLYAVVYCPIMPPCTMIYRSRLYYTRLRPYHTMSYHTIPYHTMPCHAIPHHSRPCHTILGIATMQYSPIITDAKSFGLPIYTSCTSHLQIITLHCTTQHCATLTYIKRQCITSHDTTLHCIALHCIDMHCHALACIACAPHCNKIHYIPSIQRRYTTLYYEYLTVHCTALG